MDLDKELALKALQCLDQALEKNGLPYTRMTVGGGASMLLAHGFPGKTNDVDAVPTKGAAFEEIKSLAEEIAKELGIAHDWLNPYYQTFTVYLPADAKDRTTVIYNGRSLVVESLGPEDVLIMKLMAGRSKDRAHIKHLLRKSKMDLSVVENRLQALKDQNLYKKEAIKALDLLDEETDQ